MTIFQIRLMHKLAYYYVIIELFLCPQHNASRLRHT